MTSPVPSSHARMDSPVGALVVCATPHAIVSIAFDAEPTSSSQPPALAQYWLDAARRQLDEYFAGTRLRFGLPLAPSGTAFQHEVWAELSRLPFGATTSYGELARRLARPAASRAIGSANARNPIAIVVPCHRVIGSNGSLTGYAGGLPRKARLLDHERGVLECSPSLARVGSRVRD